MVIFKSEQKKFQGDSKIELSGKRLYATESVKYLGVKIDTNWTEPMLSFSKWEIMLVVKY